MKNKLLISLLSLTISSSVFSGVKRPMVIFEKSMSESATFFFHSKKKSSFNVRIKEIGGNEQSFKTKVKDSLFVPCCVHEVEAKKPKCQVLNIKSKWMERKRILLSYRL